MIDRLALILLLAGCVLFASILAVEIAQSPAGETEAAAVAAPSRAVPLPPAVHPEADARLEAMVTEILARPLFSSTRRPPPKDDGPAADSGLADTRLTGIVTAPGHRFAIFAPPSAKPLVVSEGDTISGWHVESITPREVSLTGPEGTKTLQPKIDPTLVPPAPLPAAAPPVAALRSAVAVAPPRPGLPPGFANRPPVRPGLLRERR